MKAGTRVIWTFVVTSIALFMVVLDNLVVSTAIHEGPRASIATVAFQGTSVPAEELTKALALPLGGARAAGAADITGFLPCHCGLPWTLHRGPGRPGMLTRAGNPAGV